MNSTAKCVAWPCKRCERAGRTFWWVRLAWHRERADRRRIILLVVLGAVTVAAAVALIR